MRIAGTAALKFAASGMFPALVETGSGSSREPREGSQVLNRPFWETS